MKRKVFAVLFALGVMACAAYGLWPRVRLERDNNNVAILVDYREVATLARNSGLGVDEAIAILMKNGVTGMMVSELTGDNIDKGVGQAELKTMKDPERGTEGTVISITPYSEHKDLLNKWLRMRFAISEETSPPSPLSLASEGELTSPPAPLSLAREGEKDNVPARGPVFLNIPSNMLKNSGVLPDIDGLEAAKRAGLHVFYRPAPSPGHLSDRAAVMLREVNANYPVSVFTPSGEYVSGYPDVSKLANVAKELHIPVAIVEFSRQVGEPQLNAQSSPYLIPLHSVTNEEMTSRRISRKALRERLLRAALERSVRLLLLRTAPPNTSDFRFEDFAEEVRLLADGLKSHGFNMAWPEPVFAHNNLHINIATSWAMSAVLMLCLWSYLVRMGMKSDTKISVLFALGSVVLALCAYKIPAAARLAGALTAPMIAVEATLLALDRKHGVIQGFVFAIVGGLALASFFSTTSYMLRLATFSGVRLTLVLPPVLVLLHDLKRRVHPESLVEFLSRPPLWGELVVIAILLAGVGFMVFRSGNVQGISGIESRMRESLERWLIARPRTKEVLVGYPSILLLMYFVKNDMLAQYREILRIGAAIGFSSVVNSFCHFHTPLTLILLREVNGLWTGLIVGAAAVLLVKFVIVPLLRLVRPIIS